MTSNFKFGWKPEKPQRYEYANVWSREKTKGPERLVIAPSSDQVSVMIELSHMMTEPFGFLYILTVPRGQGEAARYQSAEPIGRKQGEEFLARFRRFFEGDGRHHLWLKSVSGSDLLVYDKHNVIYAYGQLPAFEQVLRRREMEKVDEICFPSPHIHNYNAEFDEDERDLLHYWEWTQFSLRDSDEQ